MSSSSSYLIQVYGHLQFLSSGPNHRACVNFSSLVQRFCHPTACLQKTPAHFDFLPKTLPYHLNLGPNSLHRFCHHPLSAISLLFLEAATGGVSAGFLQHAFRPDSITGFLLARQKGDYEAPHTSYSHLYGDI